MNSDGSDGEGLRDYIDQVTQLVRRVVTGRVPDEHVVDEIVQETLARLLATQRRLDAEAIGPYAIVTAKNLVASHWRRNGVAQRHQHRLFDPGSSAQPGDVLEEQEDAAALQAALSRLPPRERHLLIEHELDGRDTKTLAREHQSTPAAVAAQLKRTRAKLRVEYLVELGGEPPSRTCRPVLLALSAGDRARQAELDAGYHLLECNYCAECTGPLLDRRTKPDDDDVRLRVEFDQDIVTARQLGREVAIKAGFSATEATLIATAISEISRNIVRFATRGEVSISIVADDDCSGVMVVARDVGPGIPDVEKAMAVGYTTYGGRGLGLPGSQRLMDEFDVTSEVGRGTTVTMTKWHR